MSNRLLRTIAHKDLCIPGKNLGKSFVYRCGTLIFSLLISASLISCTPNSTPGTTIVNNNGGEKNDPGGYGGGSTGDGGGGQGIECSAETNNPEFKSKLFVRDIFEGIYIAKDAIKSGPPPAPQNSDLISPAEAQFLVQTLQRFFGHTIFQMEIGDENFWYQFVSKINFISEDAQLIPSQDANSPIALPKGCKIIQLAFWDDSRAKSEGGTLYIDKKQWLKLDSVNRAALLAHEYFFKEARQAGYKNSDFVRVKVGALFSEKGLAPLNSPWGYDQSVTRDFSKVEVDKDYKFCSGTAVDDPSSSIQIYYSKNHILIPLLRSKEISISSLDSYAIKSGPSTETMNLIHLISEIGSLRFYKNNLEKLGSDVDFWLRESAINFFYDNSSSSEWIVKMKDQIGKSDEIIWSEKVSTDLAPLQFELENPVIREGTALNNFSTDPSAQIFTIISSLVKYNPPTGAIAGAKYYDRIRDQETENKNYILFLTINTNGQR